MFVNKHNIVDTSDTSKSYQVVLTFILIDAILFLNNGGNKYLTPNHVWIRENDNLRVDHFGPSFGGANGKVQRHIRGMSRIVSSNIANTAKIFPKDSQYTLFFFIRIYFIRILKMKWEKKLRIS